MAAPVSAQSTAPQSEKPAAAEKATPEPKGQTGGSKTDKPNRAGKTQREPERAPEPGCPAIGDKLELLV